MIGQSAMEYHRVPPRKWPPVSFVETEPKHSAQPVEEVHRHMWMH